MTHNEALTEAQQDNNLDQNEREEPSIPADVPQTQALINAKCSGYFVHPLQWMQFLEQGETSGKIICPNEKCKAKVGNYDWAGNKGFCIHRSKVDELR
ncbi:9042_t:CDS:2 [Acaulospora colombiana]|uniref:9042_t:CDS:1 n=1 Tax=Acaulospora colombiana TaxID=27376 RepID=A0ACA9NRW4_9GLOM|nr:9042_t:CDS:2 [Acaulospora colombiana]